MKQEIGREDKIIKYPKEQKRAENAALLSLQGGGRGWGIGTWGKETSHKL